MLHNKTVIRYQMNLIHNMEENKGEILQDTIFQEWVILVLPELSYKNGITISLWYFELYLFLFSWDLWNVSYLIYTKNLSKILRIEMTKIGYVYVNTNFTLLVTIHSTAPSSNECYVYIQEHRTWTVLLCWLLHEDD